MALSVASVGWKSIRVNHMTRVLHTSLALDFGFLGFDAMLLELLKNLM